MGRVIHLIRTVNESLILNFVYYLEGYSITGMRRSKRKSTSTYATAAGARQSKTRKDVPVPVTEQLPHVDTLSRSIPNPSIAKNAADVGTAQNTNLLHSREEVCSASTVDTGIDKQFVVPYTLPNPVPSIHATLGAHVSQTHKNKIINGEYIDLALLLENTTISEKQEKQIVIIDGVLSTRDKTKQIINTISKWTDAFIVYISIYSSAHPSKYQALLNCMHTVRLDLGFGDWHGKYMTNSLD